MEKYPKYKDSGIQWIGEIPEHWEDIKIKYFSTYNDSSLTEKEDDDLQIEYVEIGDVDLVNGINNSTFYNFVNAPSRARRITQKDDVVISTVRTYLKAIAHIDRNGLIVSTGFTVLRPQKINSKFMSFALSESHFIDSIIWLSTGVNYPAITPTKLVSIKIPIPPTPEQEAIVSYLEKEIANIDAYIKQREQETRLLEELKQAEIANVVTKGLNPNAPMKDSGISWIGKIPEHWNAEQLRKYLRLISIKNKPNEQLLSVTRELGVIIRNVESKEENHNFIPDDLSGYKYVQAGQFVVNKMKSWQGSYGVSDFDGIVSPAYYVCTLNNINKEFFSWAIRSKAYVGFFTQMSKGIRVDQWDLSPIALKQIPFFEPPIEEQQQIVDYIESKVAKIEEYIALLKTEIERMQEYKQRLISDTVTGKIKVME